MLKRNNITFKDFFEILNIVCILVTIYVTVVLYN